MKLTLCTIAGAAVVLTAAPARAQYAISWYAATSGGATTPIAAGAYTLRTTIGQGYPGPRVSAGVYTLTPGFLAAAGSVCYANCDGSTVAPVLNVADFTCFLQKYASNDPYANCDQSTTPPTLNVADFTCFLQKYANGCP